MFQDFGAGYNRVWRYSGAFRPAVSSLVSFRKVDVLSGKLSGCVKLPKLVEYIVPTVSYGEFIEALESLHQRSLIERHSDSFTQPVIMDYMTGYF